jgi:hypothetical protein
LGNRRTLTGERGRGIPLTASLKGADKAVGGSNLKGGLIDWEGIREPGTCENGKTTRIIITSVLPEGKYNARATTVAALIKSQHH